MLARGLCQLYKFFELRNHGQLPPIRYNRGTHWCFRWAYAPCMPVWATPEKSRNSLQPSCAKLPFSYGATNLHWEDIHGIACITLLSRLRRYISHQWICWSAYTRSSISDSVSSSSPRSRQGVWSMSLNWRLMTCSWRRQRIISAFSSMI